MSQFPCDWCGSAFTTKSNLVAHQKKAVYCLEIQTNKPKTEIEKEIRQFECPNCDKAFSQKGNLNTHIKNCNSTYAEKLKQYESLLKIAQDQATEFKIRLEEQSKAYDTQIKKLELQLAEKEKNQQAVTLTAITRPTTNVQNSVKNLQINNLTPLLEGEMKEFLPNLTSDHVKDGAAGYARYALEYPLKGKIAVTDASRKKLAWKDAEGEIIYDNEGLKLCQKFFRVLRERNYKVVRELMQEITTRKDNAVEREDQTECDACDELMYKLDDYRRDVRDAGMEEQSTNKNELRDAFIKYLCVASNKQSI